MKKIILYTIDCPLCVVLENVLKRKNIEYTKCTDRHLMIQKHYSKAPMLELYHDDKVETLNFKEAMLRFGESDYDEPNN